ncbi:MAG: molybdenum cofactor biosynthesis protein MoaE [Pseudomonadota bacterium]
MIDVLITDRAIDADGLQRTLRHSVAERAGAVTSFVGMMRSDHDSVSSLTLEHYPGYTEREVARLAELALQRFGLFALLVHHRVGTMIPGDVIVVVAAASAHRREAFEACDFVMDYLKSAAPFWKKEERPDGARWVEPTARDVADRERWET